MLVPSADALPLIAWVGASEHALPGDQVAAAAKVSVLPEYSRGWMGRPGLCGHRIDAAEAGTAWSPAFTGAQIRAGQGEIEIEAVDAVAQLRTRLADSRRWRAARCGSSTP